MCPDHIALTCFVQHNKHKRYLTSDLGWLCSWLNWKQVCPPHYKTSSCAYDTNDFGDIQNNIKFYVLPIAIYMCTPWTVSHRDYTL